MIQAGIVRAVAPAATAEALTRWAESLKRTIAYFEECGVEVVEIV
jgi:hypothetical protein